MGPGAGVGDRGDLDAGSANGVRSGADDGVVGRGTVSELPSGVEPGGVVGADGEPNTPAGPK